MCEIKIVRLYQCPVCKKTYQRKGYYLNKHLKQCNAIAWIPLVKAEIIVRQLDENKLAIAIDNLMNGNFSMPQGDVSIERVKKSAKMTNEDFNKAMAMKELFQEFKNNPIELVHVPESELNHIYNIMVN